MQFLPGNQTKMCMIFKLACRKLSFLRLLFVNCKPYLYNAIACMSE